MAGKALSTIGVKFGWQLATATSSGYTYENAWEQIEECVNIGGVETTKDKLDATPLESKVKKYVGGHADTGGELATIFNASDTFEAQWAKMMTAYRAVRTRNADRFPLARNSLPKGSFSSVFSTK